MSNPPKRGKRKKKPRGRYWIYTTNDLALLFKRRPSTIRRWILEDKLNPSSLKDIVDKYNDKYLLDYSRGKSTSNSNSLHTLTPH